MSPLSGVKHSACLNGLPSLALVLGQQLSGVRLRFIWMSGDDRSGRHMLLPSRGEALAELEEPL